MAETEISQQDREDTSVRHGRGGIVSLVAYAQLVGTVGALFRYPVKSTAGERLAAAELDARGLVHDRAWAVYTADGGIASGKTTRRFRKVDGLLSWRSAASDGSGAAGSGGADSGGAESGGGRGISLCSPAGTCYLVGEPTAAAALTAAFGQPLTPRPETTVSHHDDCGIHLVTTATLRRAEQLVGGRIDPRRLRPNIVLDTEGVTFLEDGWQGAELAVGPEVVLRIGPGMPRCVMVDRPQDDVPAGPPVLRVIGHEHDLLLGVQAEVVSTGTIRSGDEARLLDR